MVGAGQPRAERWAIFVSHFHEKHQYTRTNVGIYFDQERIINVGGKTRKGRSVKLTHI